jgi:type II secretory pathway pseudopilin PulG
MDFYWYGILFAFGSVIVIFFAVMIYCVDIKHSFYLRKVCKRCDVHLPSRNYVVKIFIGFLSVIIIASILVSVVLTVLNTARNKRADAAAILSLDSARAQSELYYDNNNRTYTTVCTDGANNISTFLITASEAVTADAVCFDADTSWAASIDLNGTGTENFYCVDGAGFGGILPADPDLSDTNTTCN